MPGEATIQTPERSPKGTGTAPELLMGKVLVVDDELPNRAYLRKLLEKRGCTVIEAPNGEEALVVSRAESPDIVLVDVMMPGWSGYEVCQRMKRDPLCRDIPVIMVTGRTDIEDVEQGFVAGAFDYIRKPYNPRELVARVRNSLNLKRSNDALRLWKQRMSRELEVAGALQRKLFSTSSLFGPGYEVHLAYQPSDAVGGDVFDVLPLPDGGLCVYAGDVAGHGVAPAMVASLLKAIIPEAVRDFAARGPAVVCREIEARFRHHVENPELYATLFLAILTPHDNRWCCLNCGHPDPILLSREGVDQSGLLSGRGDMPIGFVFSSVDARSPDQEVVAPALPGAKLMLITDGLFESRQWTTGEQCGPARLAETCLGVLRDPRMINPSQAVFDAVRQKGFALLEDDCSAVTVERVDPATVRLETYIPATLNAVADIAASADRLLRAEGWPEESAGRVQLALMEHGTNVVKHSRLPPGSTIFVQVRVVGLVCRILCRDRGCEWDFAGRLAASRGMPSDRESGYGLGIIQAVSAYREFSRRGDENVAFFAILRENDMATFKDANA